MKTNGLKAGESLNGRIGQGHGQGQTVEKRFISAFLDLFGFVTTMYGLVSDATDDSTDSIENTLAEMHQSINDIQSDVDGILDSLSHIQTLVAYFDDYERLHNLYDMYLHNIEHGIDQTGWANAANSYAADGLHHALLSVNKMITGDGPLSESVFLTYERGLDRESTTYYEELQVFLAHMLSLQAAGFALWVNARIIKGEDYDDVQLLFLNHQAAQDDLVSVLTAQWPAGGWGLPASDTGCPANFGFEWLEGSRFHRTDCCDDGVSSNDHFKQNPLSRLGVEQYFCMKSDVSAGYGQWPIGKYCIYASPTEACAGDDCGIIWWSDTWGGNNRVSGTVPFGVYTDMLTSIEFICRDDGNPNHEIILPAQKPFYMIRHGSKCQKVKGTSYSEEWIMWDAEDLDPIQGMAYGKHPAVGTVDDGIKLIYCYYTPTLIT